MSNSSSCIPQYTRVFHVHCPSCVHWVNGCVLVEQVPHDRMQDFCELMNEPVDLGSHEAQNKLPRNIAHTLQRNVSDTHVTTLSHLCDLIKIQKSPDAVRQDIAQYLTTVSIHVV